VPTSETSGFLERESSFVRALATAATTPAHDARAASAQARAAASAAGTSLLPIDERSAGAVMVTDLPAHIWRVAIAAGTRDAAVQLIRPLPDGRVVATVRNVSASTTSTAVYDAQLTRAAGPQLLAPFADDGGTSKLSATCTAMALVYDARTSTLWCGWASGHVSCYTADTLDLTDTLCAHRGAIRSICANEAGTLVVTLALDRQVLLWDAASRQVLRALVPPVGQVTHGLPRSVAFSFGDSGALVGYDAGAVLEFGRPELDGECEATVVCTHRAPVVAVVSVASRDGDRGKLWTACEGGVLKMTDGRERRVPASISLNMGKISSLIPFAPIDVPSPYPATDDEVVLCGTSTGRLVAVRALDGSRLVPLFSFDTRHLTPGVQMAAVRPRADGVDRGSGAAVVDVVRVAPNAVAVVLSSGSAVALVSGFGPSTPQSVAPETMMGSPDRHCDYSADSDAVALLESRYERLLRKMYGVSKIAREKLLEYKLAKESSDIALSRSSAQVTEFERQCAALCEALDRSVREQQEVRQSFAESIASETRLRAELDETRRAAKEFEGKCAELAMRVRAQDDVLEDMRRTNDALGKKAAAAVKSSDDAQVVQAEAGARVTVLEKEAGVAAASAEASRRRAIASEQRTAEAEAALREAVGQLRELTTECHALHRCLAEREHDVDTLQSLNSKLTVAAAQARPNGTHTKANVFDEGWRDVSIRALEAENTALRLERNDLRDHTQQHGSAPRSRSADPSALLASRADTVRGGPASTESAVEILAQARRLMDRRRFHSPIRGAGSDHLLSPVRPPMVERTDGSIEHKSL
jgi:WD40 repeat protein/regulator of replication initiation timing